MTRYHFSLLAIVLFLFALGILMIFDTTSAEMIDRSLNRSTHQAMLRQLFYAFLGGCGAFGIWFLGYKNIIRLSPYLLLFFSILLVLVFVPGIGSHINGAHRWLSILGYSFQPSEFVKYLIPLYYIHAVSKHVKITLKIFLKILGVIAIPFTLILVEPDNGTAGIILITLSALFILTRVRLSYWALPLLFLALCGAAAASQMKHVPDRIKIYLHPESDLRGKGHQPYQAKIAAGSGGLVGKGIGQSFQKLNYLPEARSDYIAAIFAEEFGFIGMVLLISLYMSIGYFGFRLASIAVDVQGFYLISIITFLICFQVFLNLGVVSGLLPSKGTNLPFFSQGGSSLLANFMGIVLCLSVDHKKKSQRLG